jgi:hypothetical protein
MYALQAPFESFNSEALQNTGINWKCEISVLAIGFTIIGIFLRPFSDSYH